MKFLDKRKSKEGVKVLTFTEIRFYLMEKKFDMIPDPIWFVIWFLKKWENREKFKFTNLECGELYEKIKKRRVSKDQKNESFISFGDKKEKFRIRSKSHEVNRQVNSVSSKRRVSFSVKRRKSALFKEKNILLKEKNKEGFENGNRANSTGNGLFRILRKVDNKKSFL